MNKMDRYYADVETITATGRSRDGWITVTRASDGQLDVQIRGGMLRQLTDNEIAEEIRTALLDTIAHHHRQYLTLRTEYFGSPVGATTFNPPEVTSAPRRQP